jgi:energy-coupling factor transporter ATP-binding protein EcfA2
MILADYILGRTVKDDILFRANFEKESADSMASKLNNVCNLLPSIKPLLNRQTDELSGGEIALTLIAGMLIDNRQEHIASEFLAPLSAKTKNEVLHAISSA